LRISAGTVWPYLDSTNRYRSEMMKVVTDLDNVWWLKFELLFLQLSTSSF